MLKWRGPMRYFVRKKFLEFVILDLRYFITTSGSKAFYCCGVQKVEQHFPIYVLIYLIPTDIAQKRRNIQTISETRAKQPSSADYIFISSTFSSSSSLQAFTLIWDQALSPKTICIYLIRCSTE